MSIHNSEIADTFEKLADLLEIENANPFRVRAYRNAALTIRGHTRSMAELVAEGEGAAPVIEDSQLVRFGACGVEWSDQRCAGVWCRDRLPLLVCGKDIRGDLHCHTKASDGHASLEEMDGAAPGKGYEYLAASDHSRRVTVAHGLDATRLAERR